MFGKVLGALLSLTALATAFSLHGVVYANPEIMDVSASHSTIIPGQTVTFSVRVSPGTSHVWSRAEGLVEGVRGQTLADGSVMFTVTAEPRRTGNVYILANSTNDANTAVSRAMHITVSAGGLPQPTPTPAPPQQQTGIQILSVAEARSEAENMVRLTIVTGPLAEFVWVRSPALPTDPHYPNRWTLAALQSSTASTKTWVVSYPPVSMLPHRVEVFSNVQYLTGGASRQDFDVHMLYPYEPRLNPVIHSRNVSQSTVNVGNGVRVRVVTNQDAYSVWVRDVDGAEVVARRIPPHIPAAVRHFEAWVTPYRTGPITVYAGASVGDPNAVSVTENITVVVPLVNIVQASITQSDSFAVNEEVVIRVVTNQSAASVWAVLPDSTNLRLNLLEQQAGQSTRVWEARPAGVSSPNITIRVSPTTSNNPSVTQALSNWGEVAGGQTPTQQTVTNFSPVQARRGQNVEIRFTVPEGLSAILVSGTDSISTVSATPVALATAGRQQWGATIAMPERANITHVTLTITTYRGNVQEDISHHVIHLAN